MWCFDIVTDVYTFSFYFKVRTLNGDWNFSLRTSFFLILSINNAISLMAIISLLLDLLFMQLKKSFGWFVHLLIISFSQSILFFYSLSLLISSYYIFSYAAWDTLFWTFLSRSWFIVEWLFAISVLFFYFGTNLSTPLKACLELLYTGYYYFTSFVSTPLVPLWSCCFF